uniref:Uncharacterized protein n=1 Tax=Timema poppense TaxID=170557 RepID=A0A7R9DKI8_TIMPO|nr:unnamed protein product [Timema poppensis]
MIDKGQEDEFMKQYMDTCKEQIEKLAKDPELLNQALKPFMQMSQQLMAGGMLEGAMPGMVPDLGSMDVNKMIAQMKEMIDYIRDQNFIVDQPNKIWDYLYKNQRRMTIFGRIYIHAW